MLQAPEVSLPQKEIVMICDKRTSVEGERMAMVIGFRNELSAKQVRILGQDAIRDDRTGKRTGKWTKPLPLRLVSPGESYETLVTRGRRLIIEMPW